MLQCLLQRMGLVHSRQLAQQDLLGRYLNAWEGHDLDRFVALLKKDATAIMPPWLQWLAGRETIRSFFADVLLFMSPRRLAVSCPGLKGSKA